jgi:hypothetical protein
LKILMTGMSARSVGSTKVRYDFVALSDLLHRALEELGHEVVRRVVSVDPSDTLDEYDRVMILVNWVSSLSSMHVHEAGLAMARAGDRALYYVDDWRTESLGDDIEHHVKRDNGWANHTGRFRKDYYDQLQPTQVAEIREHYLRLIADPSGQRPLPLMIPQHPWGHIDKYLSVSKQPLNVRPLTFDPSPLVEVPDVGRLRRGRPRQWVLATLQNHDRWLKKLGNEWPVLQLGGAKKRGGGVRVKGMSPVVPERDVVRAYGFNRGMLVAPYKNAGSGWWRPRYTFALEQGAVVYVGADEDAAALGFDFDLNLDEIEKMNDRELDRLADTQREQFLFYQPTKEETMEKIDALVRRP